MVQYHIHKTKSQHISCLTGRKRYILRGKKSGLLLTKYVLEQKSFQIQRFNIHEKSKWAEHHKKIKQIKKKTVLILLTSWYWQCSWYWHCNNFKWQNFIIIIFLFYYIFFRWDDFPSIFHRECELLSSEEMFITLQILVFLIRST